MITTDGILEAYYDCRRNKRTTASAIVYEMDYESKLIALRDRINARTYQPGKSICFVVTRPRYREVFAASFEDRIVHHYIALRLEPLFELVFSPRTFNCRKEKGQLYGAKMLQADIMECSVDVINPQFRANGLDNLVRVCRKDQIIPISLDLDRQMFPMATRSQLYDHVASAVESLYLPQGALALNVELNYEVPLENMAAILDAVEKYRHYKG